VCVCVCVCVIYKREREREREREMHSSIAAVHEELKTGFGAFVNTESVALPW